MTDEAAGARSLFRRMPKAELHLHLDGSLRPTTALELASERGLGDGADLARIRERLVAPPRCRDQAQLLRAFDFPVAILQDTESLFRATAELVEDVAGDGTIYVEIRWAPALHVQGGLRLSEGIRAVVDGAGAGVASVTAGGRAIVVRLIAVAMRSHPPEANLAVAEVAARFRDGGVTGFDLAGPEAAYPDARAHEAAFAAARSQGLGITLHAGEWGGAEQVRRALRLAPARIAHGSRSADDRALVDELIANGVTLDLCPTSNIQAGVHEQLSLHPLARLARAGVGVTLSTDDRTVSDLTLVEEYARAHEVLGLSVGELWAINRHALEAAFLHHDEPLRAELLRRFDAWAGSERALVE